MYLVRNNMDPKENGRINLCGFRIEIGKLKNARVTEINAISKKNPKHKILWMKDSPQCSDSDWLHMENIINGGGTLEDHPVGEDWPSPCSRSDFWAFPSAPKKVHEDKGVEVPLE